MLRPFSSATLVVSLLVLAGATIAGTSEVLDDTRGLLDRNDGRSAVQVLEAALPAASDSDRVQLLAQLRRAYELAARQAEAAGQTHQAELYRDNLHILDRKASSAAKPPHAESASFSVTEAKNEPADDAPAAEPLIDTGPQPSPAPLGAARLAQPSNAGDTRPKALAISSTKTNPDLAEADAAFRSKRYDEAGRLYAALDRAKELPKSRREHWAYCRCADVVRRINENPRTAAEWAAIHAEIRQIRELSPQNWYAEYLRNLAAERSASAPPAPNGPKDAPRRSVHPVVIRGAAPDDAAAAATPAAPSQPPARSLGRPGPVFGNWQALTTPNFRILHADPVLAERVAQIAEATRAEQTKRWLRSAAPGSWSPRCDVYLYPTAVLFSRMTGQPEDSPGFSTMGMMDGRIVARRLNLRADHPNLLNAILPHEVTHVVLADLFPAQQIPRWADEGMAVLSEPLPEQDRRASDLSEPLACGRLFKVADLMAMDYPDGKYWGLYYAQSVSLTRFLVEQGTPTQFIEFLQSCQRSGTEEQLRRVYKIDGFSDLQRRWSAYARSAPALAAASKLKSSQQPSERR